MRGVQVRGVQVLEVLTGTGRSSQGLIVQLDFMDLENVKEKLCVMSAGCLRT